MLSKICTDATTTGIRDFVTLGFYLIIIIIIITIIIIVIIITLFILLREAACPSGINACSNLRVSSLLSAR